MAFSIRKGRDMEFIWKLEAVENTGRAV